ncbi:glycosyltransferase family 4 protein [Polynucleobacter sphagniphilus]|jgi:glycosyltransferase involved in cell wall biosynthesis|uniref:Glycosyltransferase involved in cell wall biosynthesis n=1 Tax=Polynucleobacter sphagniphilus TaxID=1743169 RepID=A0AA43MCI9_9BURK|nr:glycosyltransferase family 1 protein [Polynucleobacter sphagniphilus]MDH6504727.1 glycosyltransferase involved in cell wall biosynthesis [Polynucleobacter sphagniphilus]MDH6513461.1 glycosyltransferase involved in cell wall biosynthesis [Polynucleobacter sphagniphilus]
MRIKIAYDPQIFSFQIYGGVSRYICEIASKISTSGAADVKIVAPFFVCKYLDRLDRNLVVGFKAPNLGPLKLFFRFCSMAFGHIYLLLLKPSIIHETYFFPYALGSKKAKRVLTVHDMIHEKFASSNFLWDKASKYKLLAVHRADHIICISEATKIDLMDLFGVDSKKISVIYHGYSLGPKSIRGLSIDLKLPSRYLLYVGHRGGYKNFKRFLEAYVLSNAINQDFDIVCFGGEDLGVEEADLWIELGISPKKITHLSGGDEVLFHLYQNAGAFIFPSLYEGFGLPPLEAMSNDCVVICSNAASIPEVVGDAGEYFDPNDVEDIKDAMERVLLQPERCEELKVLGRRRIKQFSWERCASETMNLYEKLVSNT